MADAKHRTRLVALILLALTLVGAGAWWSFGRDKDQTASKTDGDEAKPSREEAIAAKRERRRDAIPLERVILGGQVVRKSDGAGVAGATVLLARKGLVQGQSPNAGQPTQPLVATTDEGGDWTIEGVDPGRYLLAASAPGYLPATLTDVRLASGVDKTDVKLVVEEGGHRLSGRVTDIGGGPIEGVLVSVADTTEFNLGFGRAPVAALTDDDGQYAMQVRNGQYMLSTWHTDYVGDIKMTEIRDNPRVEDFSLVPGGVIEGVVLARPDGAPVPGALISFSDSRSGDGGGFTTNISFDGGRVFSDDEGRFVIRGVRSGVVGLSARAAHHSSTQPLEIPLGIGEQVSDVELWVEPAFTISGFVVPRGEPESAIEGVLVGAWQISPPSMLVALAPTGDDGYFEIHGVRPGTWQVGALDEDHLMSLMGAAAVVTDADVTDLIIELDRGLRIRGRVDPPQTARITLQLDPSEMSLGNMTAGIMDSLAGSHSGEDGEFEVGPVTGGGTFGTRKVKLVAVADSGDHGELEVDLGKQDLENVVIPMTPRATLIGIVLDETGAPQSAVTVEVRPVADNPMQVGFGGSNGTPTGDDGRFAVRGLDVGKHRVVVEDKKGRALDWAEGTNPDGIDKPLEIDIEDIVTTQSLDLRVVPRDGVITGSVVDSEGLPVPDAWVTASLDGGAEAFMRAQTSKDEQEYRTGVVPEKKDDDSEDDWARGSWFAEPPVLTDENGFFTVKDLRRGGSYQLVAEGERGGARAIEKEVSTGSRITLRLEALTSIAGTVTTNRKPVGQFTIELRGPVQRQQHIIDAEGEFLIERLDPGKYTVLARSDDGEGETEVEVESGARANVKIELEGWAVLTGELVASATGEPMVGMAVLVMAEGAAWDQSRGIELLMGKGPTTDAKGRFRIDKVAPGKGNVTFMDRDASLSGGGEVGDVKYEAEAGETTDLGTIQGLPTSDVPADERGSLQFNPRVATFAERPRPPETELGEEDEVDEEADLGPARLWVYSVVIGGVAEAEGVEPGDEVVTIDGKSVAELGAGTAISLLSNARLKVGQEVGLELMRGEKRVEVRIVAVKKPE